MSDNLNIFGTTYSNVTGIKATDTNNVVQTFIKPSGTKSITANGTGIDVAEYASVDVAVPAPTPTYQSKSVTPSASQQTVTADSGYDALSQVTVSGDADLVASNIKKDVEIFGVTGSYEGGGSAVLTELEVTPTTEAQVIVPQTTMLVVDSVGSMNSSYQCPYRLNGVSTSLKQNTRYHLDAHISGVTYNLDFTITSGSTFSNVLVDSSQNVTLYQSYLRTWGLERPITSFEIYEYTDVYVTKKYGSSNMDDSVISSPVSFDFSEFETGKSYDIIFTWAYYQSQYYPNINRYVETITWDGTTQTFQMTDKRNTSYYLVVTLDPSNDTISYQYYNAYGSTEAYIKIETDVFTPSDEPTGQYGFSQVTVYGIPQGTAGTPTATKGTVTNHSVSVTPSVTNTTGYITGSTKTGTAVTVSASELVSGSETKTANGTYDVTNLAQLVVNVSSGSSKNVQVAQSTTRATSSTYTNVVSLTCSKSGTYDVYWSTFRSSTSGTWGSQLYINDSAYGTAQTGSWSNHIQNIHLTSVSITANQSVAVYVRSRGSNYYGYVGTLTIIEK